MSPGFSWPHDFTDAEVFALIYLLTHEYILQASNFCMTVVIFISIFSNAFSIFKYAFLIFIHDQWQILKLLPHYFLVVVSTWTIKIWSSKKCTPYYMVRKRGHRVAEHISRID